MGVQTGFELIACDGCCGRRGQQLSYRVRRLDLQAEVWSQRDEEETVSEWMVFSVMAVMSSPGDNRSLS